jgi:predicted extracellular nuclease
MKATRFHRSRLTHCIAAALAISATASSAYADPFISEYIEGSSNNKAIELYNPSGSELSLDGYELAFYFNGSSSEGVVIDLTGYIIAASQTFVIAHGSAVFANQPYVNLTNSQGWFNGDDAVVLRKGDQIIDRIGQIGVDPGSEWNDGVASTQNNTLRRVAGTQQGDSNAYEPFYPSQQWEEHPQDTDDNLGVYGDGSVGDNDGDDGSTGGDLLACGTAATAIHTIQGSEAESALAGNVVSIEAIVTQITPDLDGFFIQMADHEADDDERTSEGLFVYTGNASDSVNTSVAVGDRIRLQGTVSEYYNKTQVNQLTALSTCAEGQALPTPALVDLPVADLADWEQWEGMQVQFNHDLVVNETYNLARYGMLTLGKERAFIPTQVAEPGTSANAVSAANALGRIYLDDASNAQNPATVVYPTPMLSANNTVRVGDTITNLVAVLDYTYSDWKLLPSTINFEPTNEREAYPARFYQGDVSVASFNVLNYFNGDGQGAGFPTSRGADSLAEFEKQQAKVVAAISRMDADVVGLMEIENDGYADTSAIASLVSALNVVMGEGTYDFVVPNASMLGDDEIAVGLIYKPHQVTPVGSAKILDESNSPVDDSGNPLFNTGKNRPMLTQRFADSANGGEFVVAVNHLKSKGSDCESLNDPDTGDGQGNCNLTRNQAAEAIGQWLNAQYSQEVPTLVMGDLNSYAKEDPIQTLESYGYTDLAKTLNLPESESYTYVYDGESGQLDHALANTALSESAVQMLVWHINTDEPRALDYNEEYKTDDQINDYYSADPYRSSDHDPVIIEFNTAPANQAPTAEIDTKIRPNGKATFEAIAEDIDGQIADYQWDFGDGTTANGQKITHSYTQNGTYSVTLTVVDDQGASTQVVSTANVKLNNGHTQSSKGFFQVLAKRWASWLDRVFSGWNV